MPSCGGSRWRQTRVALFAPCSVRRWRHANRRRPVCASRSSPYTGKGSLRCASSSVAARWLQRHYFFRSRGPFMLWVALRFPSLALEALLRGHASHEFVGIPWAIADGREVLACDAQAQALGVHPGMSLAAAWALAPRLRMQPRDEAAERETLEGVAAWACR